MGECSPPLYASFVSTVGQESLSVSQGPWALILVWWGGEECTCSVNSGCIPCWWTDLKIINIDLGLRMTDQTRGYCDLSPQTEVITAMCYWRRREGDREPPFPSAVCYLNFSLLFLTISYMYSTCHRSFFFPALWPTRFNQDNSSKSGCDCPLSMDSCWWLPSPPLSAAVNCRGFELHEALPHLCLSIDGPSLVWALCKWTFPVLTIRSSSLELLPKLPHRGLS